jgi:hypothetical protein
MDDGTTIGLVRSESMASAKAEDHPLAIVSPIEDSSDTFSRRYNRCSFMFEHGLREHPLFQLQSLLDVARRQGDRPGFAYWSNGTVDVTDRWEKGANKHQSLLDTIAGIAENNSLVILKHTEQDPVLGPAVTTLLTRMVELSGDRMRDDVIVGRATILIASPRRITAYHMDEDTNFLLQLFGDKTISVFDQTDRTLVTEENLERFHGGDLNAAIYDSARQSHSKTYDLRAGCGIHVPFTAPHWAQNGAQVSVALSLNYDLHSMKRRAQIFSLNRRLRQLGVVPTPPGISRWRDSVKLTTSKTIGALRHLTLCLDRRPQRHRRRSIAGTNRRRQTTRAVKR